MNGKSLRLLTAAALAALPLAAQAFPRSAETSGEHFLISAGEYDPADAMTASEDGNWHAGVYTRWQRRPMLSKVFNDDNILESIHINAMLGYDLNRWLTLYGIFGGHSLESKDTISDVDVMREHVYSRSRDWALEYGVGLFANILDQEILDGSLLSDLRLTLNAGVQWTHSSFSNFSGYDGGFEWDEFAGQLTAGIVLDNLSNKFLGPRSAAFYFGPCFNLVHVHHDDYKQYDNDTFGVVLGVDFALADRTMLSVATELYRRTDWNTSDDGYYANSSKAKIFALTAGITMGF